jgi:phage major head subunit gpT-like protein
MGTIVRPAALQALQTGLDTRFLAAYKSERPLVYPQITTEIQSTKRNVMVAIADMLPQMREWLGDRVFHNPGLHTQLIENKHYELSMEVNADDVEDDELGGYFTSSMGLGERAAEHPDVLLAQVLQAGTSTLGFDGQNFFDTDHPSDPRNGTGAAQVNYAASGRALTAANWEFVVTTMAGWKAGPSGGQLIGSVPNAVIVPRQLETTARRIFEPDNIPTAAGTAIETNVFKGQARVIVLDFLNNEATTWYAVDLRSVLKPFILVKRKAPQFVMMNRPNDRMMFENNKIQFGVDGRWGVGIGTWFKAFKAVA